jgi:hypothetical protein
VETNRHDHVDLVTLEEVHRLLADTEFATIDDLKAAGGMASLAPAVDSSRAASPPSGAAPIDSGGQPPLPRRR